MAETLWSISTTIREAERIISFLKTAIEINGEPWNNDTQIKFQILLIKNRYYLSPDNTQSINNLNQKQIELLKNIEHNLTYEEAKDILYSKKYKDPAMRGRTSMSPLIKFGLVFILDKKVKISDIGYKLSNNEITLSDFMLETLLKFQYPNPIESGFKTWNTKPFINTLRLIKKVNHLAREKNLKEKGIAKEELAIFALSLKSHLLVDEVAYKIINFRMEYESIKDFKKKEQYINDYISSYLKDFKNPQKNTKEYIDNMIRYLRLTKYIYIRGKYKNTFIDLEPRRMVEINSILENDSGEALEYSETQWREYMGTYGSYILPFETKDKLIEILNLIQKEINILEKKLGLDISEIVIPDSIIELKNKIKERREYRTQLQNKEIKNSYYGNIEKINEAIENLDNISNSNKPLSVELEKWTNIALNILNDSKYIKPNYPVGDDNEPICTAPAKFPDIECYYESFNAICEVTMLRRRDQWYNEGQPVMEHLRGFENINLNKNNYCLFIAPTLHRGTISTFFISVKYQYEEKAQKIIPITIRQLIEILETIKKVLSLEKSFNHLDIMNLYENCTNLEFVNNSTLWLGHIAEKLEEWKINLLTR